MSLTKNQKRRQRLQAKKSKSSDVDPHLDEKSRAQHPALTKEETMAIGTNFWKIVKKYATDHPEFKDMKDQDRMTLFRDKFGYSSFMDQFPIVSRYMLCHGQYSEKAFGRLLDKIRLTVEPPPDQRPKGYMEDQWAKTQAFYVQYLWEAYQKHHPSPAEKACIWQNAYQKLKGEFDDFRTMHKEVEEKVKEEKKELAGQNARDLLERMVKGTNIGTDNEEFLMEELQTLVNKKMFSRCLAELLDRIQPFPAEFCGVGQGPLHGIPTVSMIETVDVNRMKEIDDKYKPPELRGMEPIIEETTNSDQVQSDQLEPIIEETVNSEQLDLLPELLRDISPAN